MTRLLALPVLLLTLPAAMCTTDQPGIQIRTVEVVREVQKPCPGIVPERPAPLARPLPTDLAALAATLAAKLGEYTLPGKYADQVDAYVRTCKPGE